jgi:hypothetical protein
MTRCWSGGMPLVLNLRLDVVGRVGRLHLEGNGFTCEGFDEDLHTTTVTKNCRKR